MVKLPRMGAAWDFYLLSDIGSPDVPAHKLYVFLNVVRAGAEMRRTIHARLQREHATSLWVYASGLYGDGGSGVEQIADLTGIRVRREAWGKPLWLGEEKEPLAGSAVALDPVFVVDDPKAQVHRVGRPGTVEAAGVDVCLLFRAHAGAGPTARHRAPGRLPHLLRHRRRPERG